MDIGRWLEKKTLEGLERSLETLTNKDGFICEANDPSLDRNKGSNVFHMDYYRRT